MISDSHVEDTAHPANPAPNRPATRYDWEVVLGISGGDARQSISRKSGDADLDRRFAENWSKFDAAALVEELSGGAPNDGGFPKWRNELPDSLSWLTPEVWTPTFSPEAIAVLRSAYASEPDAHLFWYENQFAITLPCFLHRCLQRSSPAMVQQSWLVQTPAIKIAGPVKWFIALPGEFRVLANSSRQY